MGRLATIGDGIDALASSLADEPLLVIGLAVLLVVLVAGGGYLLRGVTLGSGHRFARLLGSYDSVAVLMHPDPDPDAMACALAVAEIATDRNTETTLYYPGEIRHHENRAFETVLDAGFKQIENVGDIEEQTAILVDHNEPREFHGSEEIDPVAVVDHHPGGGTGQKFTDVRTEYGSCASILTEYFEDLGWEPISPDNIDDSGDVDLPAETISPTTATGLLYGVQSDTSQLTNGCAAEDFFAASFLYPGIDNEKLDRIANPEMDPESLDVKAQAINEREIRSAFAISDVGAVSNSDSIPQAADELRRLEGINAVIVLGDNGEKIRLAGRSDDDRVHMGQVLEAVLEDIPMSGGGGHARMGGGQCSIEHMKGLGPGEGLTRAELRERLFDAMNGET
ncbi:bifunctional oligoribonuclease/PAP phosphatase NrnA [Halovenus rubra]|uniref:Bifunctional oligoribonuclease/PAP phosphatase NrnA n=2 Tax=Halovenus rubra TaxID=869890 RepID=A0ACC7DXY6_9EURY|nr:DHHA1 domain-containing protein [Halovenus rubra]